MRNTLAKEDSVATINSVQTKLLGALGFLLIPITGIGEVYLAGQHYLSSAYIISVLLTFYFNRQHVTLLATILACAFIVTIPLMFHNIAIGYVLINRLVAITGTVAVYFFIRHLNRIKKADLHNRTLAETVFYTASQGIIMVNAKGTITMANAHAEKMFNYTEGELKGKKIEVLVPPEAATKHIGLRENYTKQPANRPMGTGVDLTGVKKNGIVFPVEVSLSYYSGTNGTNAFAFVSDITLRKEQEYKLEAERERSGKLAGELKLLNDILEQKVQERTNELQQQHIYYKTILENIAEAILLLNEKGQIHYLSPSALNISGYNLEESIGRLPIEFIYPEDVAYVADVLAEVYRTSGMGKQFECRIVTKQGNAKWIEGSAINRLEIKGVNAVMINYRDISERKTAQEAIVQALTTQKLTLDTLPANVALLDRSGIIKQVNSRWLKFARNNGMPQQFNCVGKNYIEVAAKADGAEEAKGREVAKALQEILAGKRVAFVTEYPCHSAEEQRWFRMEVRPVIINDTVSGAVVMHYNITDRKLAETELEKLNVTLEERIKYRTTELENANSELEAFTFSVSHDLRSPLRVISGFAKILERKYGNTLGNEGGQLLYGIQHDAKRMNALMDDLLNLSIVGRKEISISRIDMNLLVEEVVQELKSATNSVAEIVAEPMEATFADPILLKQVWVNLISNAIKYSSKQANAKVEVGCYKQNELVTYYVKDNGDGFEKSNASKLFKAFTRLHSNEEFEGTGIGLSIVKRIVTRHGGSIWAEGEKGKGAAFYFTLNAFR